MQVTYQIKAIDLDEIYALYHEACFCMISDLR